MRCGHENRVLHSRAEGTVEQREQQVHCLVPDLSGQVNQKCLVDRLSQLYGLALTAGHGPELEGESDPRRRSVVGLAHCAETLTKPFMA